MTHLRDALGKVLDAYDARRATEKTRLEHAKRDEAQFLERFDGLCRTLVRPVFEEAGAMLAERGHRFSLTEQPFAIDPSGKVTEARLSLHVVPAGMVSLANAESHAWTLSVSTRHYNKSVWFDAGAAMSEGGISGSKAAYPLDKVDRQLVEEQVVRFVSGVVAS
ncbi:MAG TPA: hypothetical protein VG873_13135 [Burkholderiales bacterium]|nr:hypothetical protein [Burkholderiales bacterium]